MQMKMKKNLSQRKKKSFNLSQVDMNTPHSSCVVYPLSKGITVKTNILRLSQNREQLTSNSPKKNKKKLYKHIFWNWCVELRLSFSCLYGYQTANTERSNEYDLSPKKAKDSKWFICDK